ncbi:hypothetical protein HDU84_009335 [Entophlyctis sp. JEL0112]|nr:hypothetical protein HDU84_009335 [Entophlyctis sp. JEL0112]
MFHDFDKPLREDFDDQSFYVPRSSTVTSAAPPDQAANSEYGSEAGGHNVFVDAREATTNNNASSESLNAAFSGTLGIKERDKILDGLKKENFNLKLRIFFLEERLEVLCATAGDGFGDGVSTQSKTNIILTFQTEIEDLQMDLLDERQNSKQLASELEKTKKTNEELLSEIDNLRHELEESKTLAENTVKEVEIELQTITNAESPVMECLSDSSSVKQSILKTKIKLHSDTAGMNVEELTSTVDNLKEQLSSAQMSMDDTTNDRTSLKQEVETLKNRLKSTSKELRTTNQSKTDLELALSTLGDQMDELKNEKTATEEALKQACDELEKRMASANEELKVATQAKIDFEVSSTEELNSLRTSLVAANIDLSSIKGTTFALQKSLQEENENIRKDLESALSELKDCNLSKADMEEELKKLSLEHNQLATELDTVTLENEELRSRLKEGENLISSLEGEIDNLKKELSGKAEQENGLQVSVYNLTVQMADLSKKLEEKHSALLEATGKNKNLRKMLSELEMSSQRSEISYSSKRDKLEEEVRALQMQMTALASKRATELEECIQRRNSKSPELDVSRLLEDHAKEIESYEQQIASYELRIADNDHASELAAAEIDRLRCALDSETARLREIEARWRSELSASQLKLADVENLGQENEQRLRDAFDEERKFLRADIDEGNRRCESLQAEVARLHEDIGVLKGELETRLEMHREAFGKLQNENEKINADIQQIIEEKEELERLVQYFQHEHVGHVHSAESNVESFKEILIWINTILGRPEADLNEVSDTILLKNHIRSGLEDLQQSHNVFAQSTRELCNNFEQEKQKYASHFSGLLSRFAKLEEIIKKASRLQKLLKAERDQSKSDLTTMHKSHAILSSELETAASQLFTARNDHLCVQLERDDARAELEIARGQIRDLESRIDGHKRDMYRTRTELDEVVEEFVKEREYSRQLLDHCKTLEVQASETKALLKATEERLQQVQGVSQQDQADLETYYKEQMESQQRDISESQKAWLNERKSLESRVMECEQEMQVTRKQLEICQSHLQNLKELKLATRNPTPPAAENPAGLATANDRLRSDYMHMRRLVDEKESALQDMRDQFTEVIRRLEASRLKHMNREDRYRKMIAKAVEHLDRFNVKHGGMEVALEILRTK